MLTCAEKDSSRVDLQAWTADQITRHESDALYYEPQWRQFHRNTCETIDDITISRWTDSRHIPQRGEATTPPDRYFISIALKSTRLRLDSGSHTIFEGVMPPGTLYVSAPSRKLTAQFSAPFDFLHFHVFAGHFPLQMPGNERLAAEGLNDLVLLRNPLAEQLARTLIDHENAADQSFVACVGKTLAMHIARLQRPKVKVNSLPKWRLRRVEEYIKAHFDRSISLADLAKVAGLSRMHFAAQFRVATGYRPREYLLHHRIEQAKAFLSDTETPLAEVALAVGFCTQAHFSTIFKRMTGQTPARWRCASKNECQSVQTLLSRSSFNRSGSELRHNDGLSDARNPVLPL